jgi:hypothetical protein
MPVHRRLRLPVLGLEECQILIAESNGGITVPSRRTICVDLIILQYLVTKSHKMVELVYNMTMELPDVRR